MQQSLPHTHVEQLRVSWSAKLSEEVSPVDRGEEHGGLASGEMFGPVLPALADHHQVIAPDLQGHGRTADIDRPIDVRLMADDIAALIDHLGLDKPDLVGYSLGGGVAFFTAVKYPGKLENCEGCHLPGTYYPPDATMALATTIDAGADRSTPVGDVAITPATAACSSCHSSDSGSIVLEGAVCQSRYADRRLFCPRAIHTYWREVWVERVSKDEAK